MSEDLLYRILGKIEKTSEDITEMKVVQARQEENLKNHIRRTDLAEENMSLLRREMEPVKTHVKYVQGVLKFLGGLAILATLVASILEIVGRL